MTSMTKMTPEVPSVKCHNTDCPNESRMAVSTRRPSRNRMVSTVDYDDRSAPKASTRYCFKCGKALMADLIETLVSSDTLFISKEDQS